jgi:hypothetical protein
LGPLLFLLYINDLGTILTNLNPIYFADDSNLITSGNSLAKIQQSINSEIPTLTEWLHTNRLSLNIKKTHLMIFGPNSRKEDHSIQIKIEGQQIEILKENKFLGIILDLKLNWKAHINYITQKVSTSIGILSRARKLLNPDILRQLYYSFLYPDLTYCSIIWGQESASTLWPLFRLQKRAIQIIYNIKRRDSTLSALKKLRIMRLPELHTFAVLIIKMKYHHPSLIIFIRKMGVSIDI